MLAFACCPPSLSSLLTQLPAGEHEDTGLPSRSTAVDSEASSSGTERKTRQPERVSPPAARHKAVNVGFSKSSLPKSSPGKVEAAKAASAKTAQSKEAQSKAPQVTGRNSKTVGTATSTTRGKQGKGKVRTHGAVLLPRQATLVRHHKDTKFPRYNINLFQEHRIERR